MESLRVRDAPAAGQTAYQLTARGSLSALNNLLPGAPAADEVITRTCQCTCLVSRSALSLRHTPSRPETTRLACARCGASGRKVCAGVTSSSTPPTASAICCVQRVGDKSISIAGLRHCPLFFARDMFLNRSYINYKFKGLWVGLAVVCHASHVRRHGWREVHLRTRKLQCADAVGTAALGRGSPPATTSVRMVLANTASAKRVRARYDCCDDERRLSLCDHRLLLG